MPREEGQRQNVVSWGAGHKPQVAFSVIWTDQFPSLVYATLSGVFWCHLNSKLPNGTLTVQDYIRTETKCKHSQFFIAL